jgi:hypothetical protein
MPLVTAPAQLTLTTQAQSLTGAVDGGNVTVCNFDLTRNIYVGYQSGLAAAAQDAISIPPLGAAVIDTSSLSYIVAPAAGMTAQLIPGAAQWTPSPAQVAAQISALGLAKDSTVSAVETAVNGVPAGIAVAGVPLLTAATAASTGSGTIASAATLAPAAFTVAQIGYEFVVNLTIPAAATIPYAQAVLSWSDSATGLITGQEEWWLAAGTSMQQFIIRGPSKGDTLTLTIKNFDPAQSMTYSYAVLTVSRIYTRDTGLQLSYAGVPANTNGNGDPRSNQLMTAGPTIAMGLTDTRILPLFSGLVNICCQSGVQPGVFTIVNIANQGPVALADVWSATVAANGVLNSSLSLPRSNCYVAIENAGTASSGYEVTVTAQELVT